MNVNWLPPPETLSWALGGAGHFQVEIQRSRDEATLGYNNRQLRLRGSPRFFLRTTRGSGGPPGSPMLSVASQVSRDAILPIHVNDPYSLPSDCLVSDMLVGIDDECISRHSVA